ncbi:phage tail protein [Bartonella henselae]|uniref:Protein HflK n=1 Tax=Bartonella henselae TaxID=38323 RepID=X5MHS8_BARHN|nr:FtsH protease activity modulator HflK [Bartonella henselae]MDM9996495.1 FtsH protease activity modulator HflK [Bartonella henselae]OLL49034.1 phage tail protein [Bartonella henselae]OLL49494.1 phage tail protein [Bartonella henselae]OLL50800.1 phage tail protein [Bartonella henselae]OLL58652.1 phage tail protein [Bartonella henselae]
MPWTNQNGGGPWSGDKNKLSGDKKTPSKNLFGSDGNNGGDNSPNIDDILRKGQDQFKQFGKNGLFVLLFLFAVLFWLYQSLYIVQQNEQAVELRFGVPKTETIGDGLHFHFWPIETYMKVPLTEKTIAIGGQPGQRQQSEGLMLSSDQNIVNVNFSIYYRISHPGQFLFNVNDQEGTVRQVAESAMREVIGSRPVDDVLRDKKEEVASDVRKIIQLTVDKYQLGVEISRVSISEAAPPTKVAAAFNSVQQAEQERGRMIEEGNRVRFNKIGLANGEASRTREIAKGEKARMVEEATGRAERFQAIARESAISPEAARYRLYMETMGRIFSSPNKLILDQTNSPAVPYLPLNELLRSNSSEKMKTRSAHSASLLDNHISGGH